MTQLGAADSAASGLGTDRTPVRTLRLVPPLPAEPDAPTTKTGAAVPDEPRVDGEDMAVLAALGLVDPTAEPEPVLAMSGVDVQRGSSVDGEQQGPDQPVRFRVIRRDGSVLSDAAVVLLDDRGREITASHANAQGCGELHAPHPGTYLLLAAAPDHQPGAVTVAVADGPVDAELLLVPSARLHGTVRGPFGPVLQARLTLVQDGAIVAATRSDAAGAYTLTDLAAGGYRLSVAAAGCVPRALPVELADGAELDQDVEMERNLDPGPATAPIPVQIAPPRQAVQQR